MEKETNRQKKIATLIQHDLTDIIRRELQDAGQKGIIISVTKVRVTSDFSIAKAYLSIYPNDRAKAIMEDVQRHRPHLKHQIAQRTRHQMRKMPELFLFIDDSTAYIHDIEEALKGEEDPIKNPDLLDKRKKK